MVNTMRDDITIHLSRKEALDLLLAVGLCLDAEVVPTATQSLLAVRERVLQALHVAERQPL
jgi:hypothetical protein